MSRDGTGGFWRNRCWNERPAHEPLNVEQVGRAIVRMPLLLSLVFGVSTELFAGPVLYYLDIHEPREQEPVVSVRLVRSADYVALPVTLTSNPSDPDLRNKDLQEAVGLFTEAAKTGPVKIDVGIVSLSANRGKFLEARWDTASQAKFNLLIRLDQEGGDVYRCVRELYKFIDGVRLPSRVKCTAGRALLVLEDLPKCREALLKMIMEEVQKTKAAFVPTGKVIISGLESPILVRQMNEQQVELYLRYTLSIEIQQ